LLLGYGSRSILFQSLEIEEKFGAKRPGHLVIFALKRAPSAAIARIAFGKRRDEKLTELFGFGLVHKKIKIGRIAIY
jgi:hypothetical protein